MSFCYPCSIFGMHELPNLNAKKVTAMTAVLVYDLDLPRGSVYDLADVGDVSDTLGLVVTISYTIRTSWIMS
jgi:hypothetical protein